MSDADLREALATLAGRVDETDLLDRVVRGATRRRRRRSILAIGVTVVAVAGVVVGATVAVGGGRGASPTHPRPTATSTRPLPLPARLPHYLPPGVRLLSAGPGGVSPATAAVYHAIYTVNHARIRFDIVDDAVLKPVCSSGEGITPIHPKLPCAPDNGWLYDFAPLAPGYTQAINGRTAHVATAGIGIQDIEWREGTFHYVLTSNRLIGKNGVKGISFRQLVRMAKSVPMDPSVPAATVLANPPDVSVPTAALNGYLRMDRDLLGNDGAEVDYDRAPIGEFNLFLIPIGRFSPDGTSNDGASELAIALHRASHVMHPLVRGVRSTAWTGPDDYAGLRYRTDGFIVGFTGRFGITIADFVRIASAMTIVAHSP